MDKETTDWFAIIMTGIASAGLTQLLSWLRDTWKENKAKKTSATYAASRIAITLEEYVLSCANAAEETRLYIESHGAAGILHSRIPEFNDFPSDIAWESLDNKLMNSILSFPNKVKLSNGHIIAFWDLIDAGPDNKRTCAECAIECIKRGYQALQLADDVRREYKVLASSLDEQWIREFLQEEYPKIEMLRAADT